MKIFSVDEKGHRIVYRLKGTHQKDAVAELVEKGAKVGKTAVCGLNSGAVSPMFSCIGT